MLAVVAFCVLGVSLPSAARAACAGYTAAAALRDRVVDAKVHSSKLTGAKARAAIANLKKGIALAESCMQSGSTDDRAATLGVIAQLRWNQACVLTYDGVPADRAAAVAVAKANDREMDAFSAKHVMAAAEGPSPVSNWEHFDGDIESGHPASCLE